MAVSHTQFEALALIILRKLQEEFAVKHLSKNLINTVMIEVIGDEIKIHIPAQTYNMLEYKRTGAVVHTSHGSYASKLDEEGSSFMTYPNDTRKGSFKTKPGNHKGYINKIINSAIREWNSTLNGKIMKVEG